MHRFRRPSRVLAIVIALMFLLTQTPLAMANWEISWGNVNWANSPALTTADAINANLYSPDDSVTAVDLLITNGGFNPPPIHIQGLNWTNHNASISFPLNTVDFSTAPLGPPNNTYSFAVNVAAGQYTATLNTCNSTVGKTAYLDISNQIQMQAAISGAASPQGLQVTGTNPPLPDPQVIPMVPAVVSNTFVKTDGISVNFNANIAISNEVDIYLQRMDMAAPQTITTTKSIINSNTLVVTTASDLSDGFYNLKVTAGSVAGTGGEQFTQDLIVPFSVGQAMAQGFFLAWSEPQNGMTIPPKPDIVLGFSQEVNTNATNLNLINVSINGAVVPGTIEVDSWWDSFTNQTIQDSHILRFIPSNGFQPGIYTVNIPAAFQASDGTTLGQQSVFNFTVEDMSNLFDPNASFAALGSGPVNGEVGVPVMLSDIHVGFNKNLKADQDFSSLVSMVKLNPDGTIASSVSFNASREEFVPDPLMQGKVIRVNLEQFLEGNSNYRLTINGNLLDDANNSLGTDFILKFTTGSADEFASFDQGAFGLCWFDLEPQDSDNNQSIDRYLLKLYFTKPIDGNSVTEPGTPQFDVRLNNNPVSYTYQGFDANEGSIKLALTGLAIPPTGPMDLSGNMAITVNNLTAMTMTGTPQSLNTDASQGATNSMSDDVKNHLVMPLGMEMDYTSYLMNKDEKFLMMPAEVIALTPFPGQTSDYIFQFPIFTQLPAGGSLAIGFPAAYQGCLANVRVSDSLVAPMNLDINGTGEGTLSISSLDIDTLNNKLTLKFNGDTSLNGDYLVFQLSGIQNPASSVGETFKLKTKKSTGELLESFDLPPVFLEQGGNGSISVELRDSNSGAVINDSAAIVSLGGPGMGMIYQTVSNGATTFANLATGKDYFLIVDNPPAGYLPVLMPKQVFLAANNAAVQLRLEPTAGNANLAQISVRVTGLADTERAVVFAGHPLYYTESEEYTGSAADRTYNLYLPRGQEYMIGVQPWMPKTTTAGSIAMPDWIPPMPQPYYVGASGSPAIDTIAVNRANYFIKVRVVDGQSNPIPNASVWAYNAAALDSMGGGIGGSTDGNGYCTLKLKNGTYTVGVFKPGMPTVPEKTITAVTPAPADGSAALFVVKKPERKIVGKVQKADGTAVADAAVWAYQENDWGFIDTKTDSSGQYILYVKPNSTWKVGAFVFGFGDIPEHTISVASEDVVNTTGLTGSILQVPSANDFAEVSGTVSKGGAAVANASVWAESSGGGNGTMTDSNGNYTLKLAKNASYSLHCWIPGFGDLPPIELGTLTANASVQNFAITERTITLNFGQNVEGFASAFNQYNGSGKELNNNSSIALKVPPGVYTVEAFIKGNGRLAATADTTSGNATVDFSSQIGQMVTLQVQVTNSTTGAAVSDAWVTVEDAVSKFGFDGQLSNAAGQATFTGPGGKTVKVKVQSPNFLPYKSEAITATEGTINLTCALIPVSTTYTVSGNLTGFDSLPDHAFVWANTADGKWVGRLIESDGSNLSYLLTLPGANTWTIQAKAEGYETAAANQVTITPQANMSGQNITLTAIPNFTLGKNNASVLPSAGGVVSNPDAGIKINIPAGALGSGNNNASITTQNTSIVPSTGSSAPIGVGKEINIKDNSGNAVTTLNNSIEITFDYSEYAGQLTQEQIANLQLAYWDNNIEDWVSIDSTNDTINYILRGYTNHLTKFAIVQPQQTTTIRSSSSDESYVTTGGGSLTSQTTQVVNSITGSATVEPAEGGSIGMGTDAVVEIPANALKDTAPVEVKVQKAISVPEIPAGSKLASEVYEFSVGSQKAYAFNQAVTIKLAFNPSNVGTGEVAAVHYFDESASQWVNLGGTVSGSLIEVQVDHFTKFAVIAVKAPEKETVIDTVKLSDIAGNWAEANIKQLLAAGAIKGYPDGSFKPGNTITRAEFASVLVKAFQLEAKSGKLFSDTVQHWAKESISTANAAGIVNGYSNNTFGPDDSITREQMAVMISKAAKLAAAKNSLVFADSISISDWAKAAVASCHENSIISGYLDNTFKPQGKATRAEAATVIVKAMP